jgi:hypothetical protein
MGVLARRLAGNEVRDEADVDRTAIPYTDAASAMLVDSAIDALVIVRGGRTSDPGARLSVLASLSAELDERTRLVVSRARSRQLSWEIIAERLATTAPRARSRYAAKA